MLKAGWVWRCTPLSMAWYSYKPSAKILIQLCHSGAGKTLVKKAAISPFSDNEPKITTKLTELETILLKYACTEFTYKEIADKMNKSPRTIDGYRDDLFQKLDIKTRVGLAMYAIKNGIVTF